VANEEETSDARAMKPTVNAVAKNLRMINPFCVVEMWSLRSGYVSESRTWSAAALRLLLSLLSDALCRQGPCGQFSSENGQSSRSRQQPPLLVVAVITAGNPG
jgi:hypothetical protein